MGEKLKEWWSKYEIPKSWLEVEWDVPNMDFEKGKERMIIVVTVIVIENLYVYVTSVIVLCQ